MAKDTYAEFFIPTNPTDTTGLRIAAHVIPGNRGIGSHGFIALPPTVGAQDVPRLLIAVQAALFALEDVCHNHPTRPLK